MQIFYTIFMYLALPFLFLRLLWRSGRLPAYRNRLAERLGFYPPLPFEPQTVYWIHAVSMGEVVAATPLIKALHALYPKVTLLITTTTPTGAKQVSNLGLPVWHAYLPYDVPQALRRFLHHFKPALGMIIETELWPNLLSAWREGRRPLFLMNARLSAKSAQGYARIPKMTREMLQTFTAIAAQGEQDAKRFIALGADTKLVNVCGNIKFDITVSENLVQEGKALRKKLGEARLVWIAASTHAGEETVALAAHALVCEKEKNALLILVPRHPDRFESVYKLCQTQFATSRYSQTEDKPCAVYLGDVMGKLTLFYAAVDMVFVGGSLLPIGGHNLLEPAALQKAIITGHHLFNFTDISQMLLNQHALLQVNDAQALAAMILRLHQDETLLNEMGEQALRCVQANRGALAKQMGLIRRVMMHPPANSPTFPE